MAEKMTINNRTHWCDILADWLDRDMLRQNLNLLDY